MSAVHPNIPGLVNPTRIGTTPLLERPDNLLPFDIAETALPVEEEETESIMSNAPNLAHPPQVRSADAVTIQMDVSAVHAALGSSPPSSHAEAPRASGTTTPSTPPPLSNDYIPLTSLRSFRQNDVYIQKRDGKTELLNPFKIDATLRMLSYGLSVDPSILKDISSRVIRGLASYTSSIDLQGLLALTSNSFSFVHPDYGILAGRFFVHRIHRTTLKSFVEWVTLHATGDRAILHPDLLATVREHGPRLDQAIVHARDYEYYFYSMQTLYKFYLLRVDGDVVERPQFMYMRVAVALHGLDLERVIETYQLLSSRAYSHATPVLYNAGTIRPNLPSCFLHQPRHGPTVDTLGHLVQELAGMWNADGGVGVGLGPFPAQESLPGHHSSGPVPVLRVLDVYAGFVSSNRWRRSSSITAYLPVWHADVMSFAVSSTHRTTIPSGLKHVFPALWLPDIFFRRLEHGGTWSLFNPEDVPLLFETFGDDFTTAYEEYEASGLALRRVDIDVLWTTIVDSERESGTPFLLMQDNINRRNNEAHLGIIQSSNLCTEIMQYSSSERPAVCTLASVSLPSFVQTDGHFDFAALHRAVKVIVYNTDKCIDISAYPNPVIAESARSTRALGVGVQGFADALMLMRTPFGSVDSKSFNVNVFETMYHAALESSCDLAEKNAPYPAWDGSPASKGILQMDMWGYQPSRRYDFDALRTRIRRVGLRNSLLTALMPTASTSKLLGNFESFEPYSSTCLVIRTSSGDFPFITPHLVHELESRGLWTDDVRREVLRNHSSIQACPSIPNDVKAIYKTVWDLDPIDIIDMAADRAPFIDQSQSLTLSIRNPTPKTMKTLMIHAWRKGLKTGLYYLRTLHPAFTSTDPPGFNPSSPPPRFDCCA